MVVTRLFSARYGFQILMVFVGGVADQVAVLEHFQRKDRFRVSSECPDFLPLFQIPQFDRRIA